MKRLTHQGKRRLCIWDGSVLEKPESEKLEGLCPVSSSKAKRLQRIKKGLVFNFPIKKPITVAGRQWGDILLHIFDRGYASGPWVRVLQSLRVKFVIRWKKGHFFVNEKGEEKKLWQIGLGKKYLSHKEIRDAHTGEKMPCDIWWTSLWHPSYPYPLCLVQVRVKKKVGYLITNEPVRKEDQAWEIVFAYRRRWQIETSFRYGKSE